MERPHNGFSSVPELSFHHQPCNSSECNFICTSSSKSLLTWCALRAQAQLGTIALSDVCIVPVPGRVLEWFEAICGVWNLFFFFCEFTLKPCWVKEASQSQKARSTLYHVFRDSGLWLPEVEREKLKEGE